MEEKIDSKRKHVSMKGDDLVFPIMALLFAIYYLYTIIDLSWEAQINGVLISTILIILVLIFLVRIGLEVVRGKSCLRSISLFTINRIQMVRIGFFSLAIVYVLVIPWAGFTLTTFTFLIAGMFILGVRSALKLLSISFVFAVSGYYFFISLLDTPFAPGPVEHLINWLF